MKRGMYTYGFWRDATERVLATAVQAAVAVLVVDGFSFNWEHAAMVGVAAGLAALKAVFKEQREFR